MSRASWRWTYRTEDGRELRMPYHYRVREPSSVEPNWTLYNHNLGRVVISTTTRSAFEHMLTVYLKRSTSGRVIKPRDLAPEYGAMAEVARSLNETNDCAVRAVCATTGEDYKKVHALFAAAGRKARGGSSWGAIHSVLASLGHRAVEVHPRHFIDRYPGGHKAAKFITSHHPDRFSNVWADGLNYILDCRSHVLGVVNGKNCDWSRGKRLTVRRVLQIIKLSTAQE